MHPDDERYKKFHGKMLVHPFVDRKIPVVLDPVLVDMEFGTGAVKVGGSGGGGGTIPFGRVSCSLMLDESITGKRSDGMDMSRLC